MIDVYASRASYWRHLAPVVDELRHRGHEVTTWSERLAQPWGARWADNACTTSVRTLVASWEDATRLGDRPVIYLEHGAGQTYADGDGRGWAGGRGLEHVRLFLTPSGRVADRWRHSYPQAAVAIVGDPALDRYVRNGPSSEEANRTSPLVVVTAHWRCTQVPETWPAIEEYSRAIGALPGTYHVVGHAHPRDVKDGRRRARRWGAPFEPDPDVVLCSLLANSQQRVLVADNTSLMYEAAALDVPVLALNARRYRRDLEHGLRFWSHVPGVQVDDPEDFRKRLDEALADPTEFRELRAAAAAAAYDHLDGRAAARAADAIEGTTG